jgi:hypothetical protein
LTVVSLFSVFLFFFAVVLPSDFACCVLCCERCAAEILPSVPSALVAATYFIASPTATVLQYLVLVGLLEYLVVNQVNYVVAFPPQKMAALSRQAQSCAVCFPCARMDLSTSEVCFKKVKVPRSKKMAARGEDSG